MPLDDLFPTNDRYFEPVMSGDFFNRGSSFWEFSDEQKWLKHEAKEDRLLFQRGYLSGLFQCVLLSGRAFMFPMQNMDERVCIARAESFGRKWKKENGQLIVYGHDDRTED